MRITQTACLPVCVQGAGRYRSIELWQDVQWSHFRDDWPDIFINNVEAIAGRDGGCYRQAGLLQ